MLIREHLAPLVAADAHACLEQAFSARADALLLDLGRPGTANMELLQAIARVADPNADRGPKPN